VGMVVMEGSVAARLTSKQYSKEALVKGPE